jgi:ATP-dependent phosphofructokinase / diphosphate-dependent phosphofructokinase
MSRIGVLTGGGDCPGLNAALRAIVKTAIVKYGFEVVGYKDGFKGLVNNEYVKLGLKDVSGILDRGGTILGTTNSYDPFNFRVIKDGVTQFVDMSSKVIENLSIFNVDSVICIGGDGTMKIAQGLYKKGVNVVGVPKTIDNDLDRTEATFGFMTAVDTATEAIDRLHSTADSHHRIMILEVMGRECGWIALESGIAGGADVIVIPEIPYDINKICQQVLNRKNSGKNFSIIVVAEGAISVNGERVSAISDEDGIERVKYGGIAKKIADDIEEITGIDTRVTVLGYLQRGGRPVTYDRILSTRFGVAAVDLIGRRQFGWMVSLGCDRIISVKIEDAVQNRKKIDPKGEYVEIARSIGVSMGD